MVTGECAAPGALQVCAAAIGAAAGLVTQGVTDFLTGSAFEPENYIAAAMGGTAGGVILTTTANPALAKAAAGAVAGATQEGLSSALQGENVSTVAGRAAVGGAVGAVAGQLAPVTSASGRGAVAQLVRSTPVGRVVARNEQMTTMNLGRLRNGSLPNVTGVTANRMIAGVVTQGAAASVAANRIGGAISNALFGSRPRRYNWD